MTPAPAQFYCPDCEETFVAGENVIDHPRYRLDQVDACPHCDRLADDCLPAMGVAA